MAEIPWRIESITFPGLNVHSLAGTRELKLKPMLPGLVPGTQRICPCAAAGRAADANGRGADLNTATHNDSALVGDTDHHRDHAFGRTLRVPFERRAGERPVVRDGMLDRQVRD